MRKESGMRKCDACGAELGLYDEHFCTRCEKELEAL